MNTYLFTWNPRRSPEPEMPILANETAAGKIVRGRWSCGNTKSILKGDRVFLIRLGVEPKGIVGSGWVFKPPFKDTHWDLEKARRGLKGLFVICDWERIIDMQIDSPLLLKQLPKWNSGNRNRTPQSSGFQIPQQTANALEKL